MAKRTGDDARELVGELVDRHYDELFAYLYRLVNDRDAAQELVQETFLRAYDAGRVLGRRPDRRAWLYRAAGDLAGVARDPARGFFHHAVRRGSLAAASNTATAARQRSWGVPGPAERALAALTLEDRALVLLCRRHGFGVREAGAILGIDTAPAGRRLAAAYGTISQVYGVEPGPGEGHEPAARLLAYNQLSPDELAGVNAHLASCPACRSRLASYRRFDLDLARLPHPWPSRHAPALLADAIRSGDISALPRIPRQQAAAGQQRKRALAAVFVLCLVVSAALWAASLGFLKPKVWPLAANVGTPVPTVSPSPTQDLVVVATQTATPVPVAVPGEPPPEAVAWLAQNAVPLESVEPGVGSADLASLIQRIGDVRIVALDDDLDFGSHEPQAFRQRLLEALVQEKGFTTLVLQVDWAAGQLLDQYAQGAGSDPMQVLDQVRQGRGLAGGVWQSQEMLYTLRWLRGHNERQGEKTRVRVQGFLPIERPTNIPRTIAVDYLQRVDPSAVERAYGDHQELLTFLQSHRDQYLTRSAYPDYRRAVSAAQILVQYDGLSRATSAAERGSLYDAAALENLIAIADQAGPDARAMLWTQSLSTAGLPGSLNLLQSVRRQTGGAITLGFAFDRGSAYLVGHSEPEPPTISRSIQNQYGRPATRRLAEYSIPPPPPATYESYLGSVPEPRFFVDLRSAFGDLPATNWLRGPHLARSIAADYWDCFPEDYYRRTRLSMDYDLIVYFRRVTPATLLYHPPSLPNANCPTAPIGIDLRQGVRGWTMDGDTQEFAFGTGDAPVPADKLAAFIRTTGAGSPESPGSLLQSFRADAYRGHSVRFSARALGQGDGVRAELLVTVAGLGNESITSVTKPVGRSDGWQRVEILVDVPRQATHITLGARLRSQGWLWFGDEKFEIVDGEPSTSK